MSLASDTLITAKGWNPQEPFGDKKQDTDDYFKFADDVAITFGTPNGKRVLESMVNKYLLNDIVSPYDTQFASGIKQGQANVIKAIMSQIEISNNKRS